jgi:Arc/MetJ-type ribon-helix-helix transcriptional regulator
LPATENKKVSVLISSGLYDEIQQKIEGTGFSSVDDYINYLLQSSLGKKSEDLSAEDTEVVTARLKALGYI